MAGRKKKGSDEGGVPTWIVTFSDLMSLLLTFFVLLLSFSTISEEEFNQAMSSLQGALGVLSQFDSVVTPLAPRSRRPDDSVTQAARRLRELMQIQGRERQVRIELDALGGIKVSLSDAVLFDPGSAELKPESFLVLESIAEVLGSLPDVFFEVHGHTDGMTLGATSQFRDNYDLSYFRAHAVTERLVTYGRIPMEQFEIVAAGPGQPIATNATNEGRAANRRVDIFVRGLLDRRRIRQLGEGLEGIEPPDPDAALPLSPESLDSLR